MKSSKVLLAAVFITVVILVMVGGVTRIAMGQSQAENAAVDPAVLEAYQQREAEYTQLIEQANQQLNQANEDLQKMQNQLVQIQQGAVPVVDAAVSAPGMNAAPAAAVSVEQAGELAKEVVEIGQTLQKDPELVSFEGKTAYEAVFEKGSVFVDAQSGEILFNGTVPHEVTPDEAARIASEYLQIKDIVQVDMITFRGAPLHRVIFKNGMMAYLDVYGQITYVLKSVPKVVAVSESSGGDHSVSHEPQHEYEHEEEHEEEHEGHDD